MNKYAIFLRGVNVGGHAAISMSLLKQLLADEGYRKVETLLNSGNVILETSESKDETETHIRQIIEKQFGLSITVFAQSKEDLEYITANDPFDAITEPDNARRMVAIFRNQVTPGGMPVVFKDDREDASYYLRRNLLYIYYKTGAERAKITNPAIKQLLRQDSTSRNWNTVSKMLERMTR
jgi:uncharacterized protein (DUF1697 family)